LKSENEFDTMLTGNCSALFYTSTECSISLF